MKITSGFYLGLNNVHNKLTTKMEQKHLKSSGIHTSNGSIGTVIAHKNIEPVSIHILYGGVLERRIKISTSIYAKIS